MYCMTPKYVIELTELNESINIVCLILLFNVILLCHCSEKYLIRSRKYCFFSWNSFLCFFGTLC